jgi:hypothetical protein
LYQKKSVNLNLLRFPCALATIPLRRIGMLMVTFDRKVKSMDKDQHMYTSYLLRLWQTRTEHDWVWRASLEHPESGERLGFASLQDLFVFLKETIMGSNIEWQKHQVNERIDSVMGEANSHRMVYPNTAKRGFSLFGFLKGFFTTSKESLPVDHKADITDTSHTERLIEY